MSRPWHAAVAASTGFADTGVPPDLDVTRHPVLSGYLEYHLPFYEKLYARRLAP